jgi:transposase
MKYIGMDAHSRENFFVVLSKKGRVLKRASVPTKESLILDFVRSIRGPKSLAIEECSLAHWLYVLLKDEVDELIVCQPPGHSGPKTDEIDAEKIAHLLRSGMLKSVFHADCMFTDLRTLVSGYGDVVQEIVRAKNRYKSLFRRVAVAPDGQKIYSDEDMLTELQTDYARFVARNLREHLDILELQKEKYIEQFEANAQKFDDIKRLTGIPGIGPVRANQIVAIVVSPHRFPNKYHFFSYAMLTNHSQTSGGKIYGYKRIHGQKALKAVFKSAMFASMRSRTSFKRKYDAMIEAGTSQKAARNAITRTLAATVLGVWKSGKDYNDKYKEVTQRRHRKNCQSDTAESLS